MTESATGPPAPCYDRVVHQSEPELYRALFELSQSISGAGDLSDLCASLAHSLRRVIAFDFLGLVIWDQASQSLRLHALNSAHPKGGDPDKKLAGCKNTPVDWVWEQQRPLTISHTDTETRWPEFTSLLLDEGVQSLVMVPLTAGERRVGVLGFGCLHIFEPAPDEVAFFERVASEVAVTVDSHLTRQQLMVERDRLRVLFDIGTHLVSKLSRDELFKAISEQIARVVAHDLGALSLLDKSTGQLRVLELHSFGEIHMDPESLVASPEGMPSGEALRTGAPVVITEADLDRFPSPIVQRYVGLGFRSACSIPLITGNGALGALDLARTDGKPFTSEEVELLVQVARQIAIAIENALAYRELAEVKDKLVTEKLYLEDEIRFDQNLGDMVGESPAFQTVLRSIQVVAPTEATVLILGETGTGKELVARAIHDMSGRSQRSFVKVNCAAIPASLLESELFGHEKGAFTGALAQKAGRFELAHQGTLFLDEIGEIPLELQSKLLRALQEQEFERLGGNRTIHVDARFVAATNRDLKAMVEAGTFRSDLYYRLHVFPLAVPPLRERREDIPLLIRFFVKKYAQRVNRHIESIPSGAIEALTRYAWPGNIRELQNVIERSVILSSGPVLRLAMPEIGMAGPAANVRAWQPPNGAERERILHALQEAHGVVSGPNGAAARLGLRRTTLQYRMKMLKIGREYR
jgi:formate hydrogenlyase transcriptional activator